MEDYLGDANAVQRESAPAFRRANAAYAGFSAGEIRPSRAVGDLRAAERSIRSTRTRLAELDPPAAAAELHRRLLRVYDLNLRLAAETTRLARYLPAATAALRPLRRINKRLRGDLGSSESAADQSAALGRYAEGIGPVLVRLRRLSPPPVLAAADRARRHRLASTRKLAEDLSRAVEGRDSARVARLLLRFRRLTGSANPDELFTQGSLRAYNRRYREIARAAGAAQQERRRVERSL